MNESSRRLVSLDVFRGATIAGMMLVNNPGAWEYIYAPFAHSRWNGWTYADTIFPSFLWIVGVSMTLSMARRKEQGAEQSMLLSHVFLRTITLFVFGLFLSGFPFGFIFGHTFDLSGWRIPGVLQRIAVCYLVASIIVLFADVRWQFRWIGILLVGYWIAMKTIPVPGYGPGVLQPVGSLSWYIDSSILGARTWLWSWWRNPPAPGFDPEGIFSTVPAIATVLFGVAIGHLLRSDRTAEEKTSWMFFGGSVLMLTGLIMDNWLPINKGIWTSSFTVFMAGLSILIFASCFWVVEVKQHRRWTKWLEIYGANAISMFLFSGLFGRLTSLVAWTDNAGNLITLKSWYYEILFISWISDPMMASFIHSLVVMILLYAIAWIMYKRMWIINV